MGDGNAGLNPNFLFHYCLKAFKGRPALRGRDGEAAVGVVGALDPFHPGAHDIDLSARPLH